MQSYCPHALADGNQHIRIREKTLEFSTTLLSTLSPYLSLYASYWWSYFVEVRRHQSN